MKEIKRRKIYYVNGIISLAILPFTFIFFATKEIKARTFRVIPILFADTSFAKENPELFNEYHNQFPPKRNYLNVNVTGNLQTDQAKIDMARLQIRNILLRKDSSNGIHFKFNRNSQYGEFVKTIDILRIEGAKTYMPIDSDVWFYQLPADTSNTTSDFKCLLCDDVIRIKADSSMRSAVQKERKNIWTSSWQIILGFAGFLLSMLILYQSKTKN